MVSPIEKKDDVTTHKTHALTDAINYKNPNFSLNPNPGKTVDFVSTI